MYSIIFKGICHDSGCYLFHEFCHFTFHKLPAQLMLNGDHGFLGVLAVIHVVPMVLTQERDSVTHPLHYMAVLTALVPAICHLSATSQDVKVRCSMNTVRCFWHGLKSYDCNMIAMQFCRKYSNTTSKLIAVEPLLSTPI